MKHINPNRLGFVMAVLLAGIHAVWLGVVAVGAGEAVGDFVLRVHMMEPGMSVAAFSAVDATVLLLMAATAGYLFGAVAAVIWNASAWVESCAWPRWHAVHRQPGKPA